MNLINLSHGSGGFESSKLIEDIFYKHFNNNILLQQNDASIIGRINGNIAVTTDSFVVDPIFFHGGDIGRLSICGTINDLAVSGARPCCITAGFIIEEGMDIESLEKIARSMAETAKECNVDIVAGDTKVVERGRGHKVYINTTGVGIVDNRVSLSTKYIEKGDKVIISGSIGEHGMCILNERENLSLSPIYSDVAPLNKMTEELLEENIQIKYMRDPTRGGVAQCLNEIASMSSSHIVISEESIPIKPEVKAMCNILGMDPLYSANEGKVIIIVDEKYEKKALEIMKKYDIGKESAVIGEVASKEGKGVTMTNMLNATRRVPMLRGEHLPRMC